MEAEDKAEHGQPHVPRPEQDRRREHRLVALEAVITQATADSAKHEPGRAHVALEGTSTRRPRQVFTSRPQNKEEHYEGENS
jgi:hypothetical protein